MLEMFNEWVESRHEYAIEWKKKNPEGRIIGYFCTYVPEEILYAGNILPIRILGSHEPQNVTEPHVFGMYCPFCRDCLAQGLEGRYEYLDGIMIAQSCLHIRQVYSSWTLHIPVDYQYYLPMPGNTQTPRSIPFLAEEYLAFKKSLEKWLRRAITNEDLDRGIQIMNQNRRLMQEIYEMRKGNPPPLTGLEAMEMVVSSQLIDKKEHNRILEDVLKLLPNRKLDRPQGKRLMILGSENDDRVFVKMVESVGATIVIDDHCTGSRYFWKEVEPDGEPLTSIAKRYIEKPPCPSKDWPERKRVEHVLELAKAWEVSGAIIIQQKFCDPHEMDIPAQKKYLNEHGIPTLILELDVTVPVGQFRIRVEAFLEMIGQEDLF